MPHPFFGLKTMRKKHFPLYLLAAAPLIAECGSCDDCCDCEPAPSFSACECCDGPKSIHTSIRHIEGGGIGYEQGYTSLDFFWAPSWGGRWSSFLDARGHFFNNGKWASNLGIGLRFLPECYDLVFGSNVYWDWRQVRRSSFNQIGAGLELLSPCWDIRLDGYVPIGRDKKRYRNNLLGFRGHEALAIRKWEFALWGADAAFGRWLYKCDSVGLHAAIAGYYFSGDYGKHGGGGLLRAKLQFKDGIDFKGQVSYDNLFRWKGQIEVALNFSFGCPVKRSPRQICCCSEILLLEERLVEQPERFEIIVTKTRKKTAPAISPITGVPLQFWFVNNTATQGDGTFESPFPRLVQAQNASSPADVIYIIFGKKTDQGMNAGITLKDNQTLTSSFVPFPFQTAFGNFVIPSSSTSRPLISNIGDAVILANNNTISGLDIEGTTSGVASQMPITNLTLFNNIIAAINDSIGSPDANGVLIGDTFNGDFISSFNDISATSAEGEAIAILLALNPFIGTFSSSNDTLSASALNGQARGIAGFSSIDGTFSVSNDIISISAEGPAPIGFAQGIRLPAFNGTFLSTNNEISTSSLDDLSESITARSSFTGTFSSSNDRLLPSSFSPTAYAAGITMYGALNGAFSSIGTTITPDSPVDAAGIYTPNVTGSYTVRSNTITAAFDDALFLEGDDWQATIMNNSFISDNFTALEITNDSGTSHLKLVGNTITGISNIPDGTIDNTSGTLEVESTDGAITGVEAINNNANLGTSGTITYVPLTP